MRILAIGDPHGVLPKNLDKIVKTKKPDVIVCTGDIAGVTREAIAKWEDYSKEKRKTLRKKWDNQYRSIIEKLCSYELPMLVLRGNAYASKKSDKFVFKIFNKYKNLIYKPVVMVRVGNQSIGSVDLFYEPEMSTKKDWWNKGYLTKFKNLCKKHKLDIIVSHAPPYGFVDKLAGAHLPKEPKGKHVGSKNLLDLIKKYKPKLFICGHIHEAKGIAKIGKTTVVNCGSCGSYAIIDINKTVKVDLK